MKIICFHNTDEENGYLSNWYPVKFTVDSVAFSSMEQFMMYKKALYFGDYNILPDNTIIICNNYFFTIGV